MRSSLASRGSCFLAAAAPFLVAACNCNEAPPEPVNRNGISEGHMPPELPPVAAPKSTDTASAAPSASNAPPSAPASDTPELEWKAPEGWRFLGAPSHGPMRGHFYALEEPGTKPPEHVDVYVVQQLAAKGATPEERMKDAVEQEGKAFAKVDSKEVTTRLVAGQKVNVVELTGIRREQAEEDQFVERPNRMQLSVLLPTERFPLRVAMNGRKDLVERSRASFFEFVESVRVKPPR